MQLNLCECRRTALGDAAAEYFSDEVTAMAAFLVLGFAIGKALVNFHPWSEPEQGTAPTQLISALGVG
jgi:hypothetical protein